MSVRSIYNTRLHGTHTVNATTAARQPLRTVVVEASDGARCADPAIHPGVAVTVDADGNWQVATCAAGQVSHALYGTEATGGSDLPGLLGGKVGAATLRLPEGGAKRLAEQLVPADRAALLEELQRIDRAEAEEAAVSYVRARVAEMGAHPVHGEVLAVLFDEYTDDDGVAEIDASEPTMVYADGARMPVWDLDGYDESFHFDPRGELGGEFSVAIGRVDSGDKAAVLLESGDLIYDAGVVVLDMLPAPTKTPAALVWNRHSIDQGGEVCEHSGTFIGYRTDPDDDQASCPARCFASSPINGSVYDPAAEPESGHPADLQLWATRQH